MRSGDALIRLAKHKIDGLRKLIQAAEESLAEIDRQLGQVDQDEKRERAIAARSGDPMGTLPHYLATLSARRANLRSTTHGITLQIEGLRGELRRAFEDQKRFELLEERRRAREAEAAARREQALMDESATIRAARR